MARAVVPYEKELPEIPGRCPWERPTQHLVKDDSSPTGWSVADGRRPSNLLLVPRTREEVAAWRGDPTVWSDENYNGACEVTKELFRYWFYEDHEVPDFGVPFRYWFCQREAMETLAWLVEIAGIRDAEALIRHCGEVFQKDLLEKNIEFRTRLDQGREVRVLRRYVAELDRVGEQDLPPENLRRLAFKLATGAGKTWVMAMAVVWSYFHKRLVAGSDLSTNFLVVAPNVIVYQRLEKDFAACRLFQQIPLVPPQWRGQFGLKAILRGEATEPDPSGNLFLTNIHQLYESREEEWAPANPVEAVLGKKPKKDLAASSQRSILERVKSLRDLVVINDEAHHVHDPDLAWSQSLLGIHREVPRGLSLWLDFSATPKDQNGMYFPWTVCDYPLAQAVEDRIVKAPIIVTKEDDPKRPSEDPDGVTRYNIGEKYGYWLRAAVERWNEHHRVYKGLGARPVLFITAEKNVYADAIANYLVETKEFGFKESEVLVIHTDEIGEITQKDLEKAREAARDIDKPVSKIKAIVSVMMLREGWDVRSVTVVLGLRPFTARAEILPEQVIGRGLRLMTGVGPDRTQTLEVLGTKNLLKVLRTQLETEGVGVAVAKRDPMLPVRIYPVREKVEYDIVIPLTKLSLSHDLKRLQDLKVDSLGAIFDQSDLAEPSRIRLKLEFATTETEVHRADIGAKELPPPQDLLASITNKVIDRAKLGGRFAEVYPIVRSYVASRCFGTSVPLETDLVRSHLARLEIQEAIATYLSRQVGQLTAVRRTIELERPDFRLSETRPFSWSRNLPSPEARKTVFNYVATYNAFERRFAEFLDDARDVLRFASLATTEQGDSGAQFRVDYLKPSGAIGFYHPDWAVVQRTPSGEVNWIIETKGRVWEGTVAKDEAVQLWCSRITEATGNPWRYTRVNQPRFAERKPKTLQEAIDAGSA